MEEKERAGKIFSHRNRKQGRSISKDLSLYLVIALAIIMGMVSGYEYFGRSQMIRSDLKETADNYIYNLTQAVSAPVWNFDLPSLKKMCDAYTTNGNFAFLKITDNAGNMLYSFVRPVSNDNFVERSKDIVMGTEKIGKVRFGLSTIEYERTLNWILFISGLTFLVSVFTIYIITDRLLAGFIRKPLLDLLEGMDRVALGDFSFRFEKIKYREIAEIADRFNRMSSEVSSREKRLEEVNKALVLEVGERRKASESLLKSEKKYRALVETTSEGFMMINDNHDLMDVNPAFCRMLGYSRSEILGSPLSAVIGSSAAYSLVKHARTDSEFELSVNTKKGHPIDIYIHAAKLFESESVELTFAFVTDISEYKKLAEALKASEEEYRTIAENTYDWEMWIHCNGSIRYVSPSCERISGYKVEDFISGNIKVLEILHPDDHHLWKQFLSDPDSQHENLDLRLFKKDGLMCWVSLAGHEVFDSDEESLGIRLTLRDITKRKFMEKQLHYEALHDPLTGLANRNLCLDRIIHSLERAARRDDYHFAVVFMDLDRFKVINDSLGHSVGDKLLIEVSKRLLSEIRELDTVSRFGGDEFVILLEELGEPDEAVKIIDRLDAKLKEPMILEGHTISLEASYGVVLDPAGHGEPDKILQNANIAMHQAKDSERSKIKVFNPEMLDQARLAMTMQNDLKKGIENNDFYLVYQPVYSLLENKIVGFEALVRWEHPEKGLIMPGDFIPISEESRTIIELGQWIINRACEQTSQLISNYKNAENIVISVNVSAKQFTDPDLLKIILAALNANKLPSANIKIEITETAIMERHDLAVEILDKLNSAGVRVSIDDFGTGYSSMSNLQSFPLEQLKIDLSFVSQIDQSSENMEIVRAIVNLAHNLGLNVVAEGIENEQQQNILMGLGCEYGQGYYYSRPVSFDAVENYFRTGVLEEK
jgi:diguanylate cyclase (GGDEF)-like protein/PAS domain S-box-containing protein